MTHSNQDTEHCSRYLRSVVESGERVSNESEEGGGSECGEVGEQQECKVETSIRLEASHEVNNDGEDDLVVSTSLPSPT